MSRLFYRSNLDGTDLKVAVPGSLLAAVAFLLMIFGLVPDAVLQVKIGDVQVLRLLVLVILSFGATLLLPLVGLAVPNELAAIPKVALIAVSLGILCLQVMYITNQGLVIGFAVMVWFLVGADRFFENPHIVVNTFVSGLRISQTLLILVSTWIILGSML